MPSLTNVIRDFLEYLKKQRGYSDHTIEAYRRDLSQFTAFAEKEIGKTALTQVFTKPVLRAALKTCLK